MIPQEIDRLLASRADPIMLPVDQARGLYSVLEAEAPKRRGMIFVEFGTFRATPTSVLASFASQSGSRVISVDTFDGRGTGYELDTFAEALDKLKSRGFSDTVQLVRSATQFFDYPRYSNQPIDVFFHDASHIVQDILFDFGNIARYLAGDSLVLIHDVAKGGGPTPPALEYLCRLFGVKGRICLDVNLGAFRLNGNPLQGNA